jgi:hypothetical protein
MRLHTLILASLLCWCCYAAGPTLVQQKVAASVTNSTTVSVVFTNPVTAGSSVCACIGRNSTIGIISVIMDGGGAETMTQAGTVASATLTKLSIFYVHAVAGGETGFTVTYGSTNRTAVNGQEWTGLTNATPEAFNKGTAVADANPATGSVTPVSANNLLIGCGNWTLNDYSTGPTNGFTRLTPDGNTAAFLESAYLVQSSATTNSTGWTLSAGINWAAGIAVFGAPTTGPTSAQSAAGFWAIP